MWSFNRRSGLQLSTLTLTHLARFLTYPFYRQALGIQRYVFFSIYDCDKHPEVGEGVREGRG